MNKSIRRFLALALIGGATACAASLQYTNDAGQACDVIVTAVDPGLLPICTTATALADAIQELIIAHGGVADAGAGGAPAYVPSKAEIYAWLVKHGATTVRH
jgi:hypothetical protein